MSEKNNTWFQNDICTEDNNITDSPKQYKVILHNDDYTPMDFVVNVLINVFRKTPETATQIMLTIHSKGKAVCGVYTYEIAETKITQTHREAQARGYPLHASMEEE